ncbi:YciI family protein [Lysobacter solisilvae (ex Woo and Kim 2020)]|uniref:YciI family protein n=1 Tax=Agrilutibacter terrestris TaxID=2865112 RepID=A0A7H0G071_9GAMM|nr:YciI family protein [Lysobacter terrestris]QNP41687.1 YciI family protein [Lysobacter terrestris]
MQFLMLVYSDATLLDALPGEQYDKLMRGCLEHADELHAAGKLKGSRQLEPAATARTIRTRNGSTSVVDGPFAETKEMLAGFNIIEADSFEEAVRIAMEFPWSRTGSIEVRPIRDMDAVRGRVGAAKPRHAVGSEAL